MKAYDVCVIGGGTAGTFSAICAARLGAKTLLIEKSGMLGGTMTSCRVNYPGLFHAWGKQIISGPCFEAIEKSGAKIPKISFKPQNHWDEQIYIDIFSYVHTIENMCISSKVDVLYHTMVHDIEKTEDGFTLALTLKEGSE